MGMLCDMDVAVQSLHKIKFRVSEANAERKEGTIAIEFSGDQAEKGTPKFQKRATLGTP